MLLIMLMAALCIHIIGDWFDSLIYKVSYESSKIDKRLRENKLSFNRFKSQYSMFINIYYMNSSALQIWGQILLQYSHSIFVGIVIDDNLSFSAYIKTVCYNTRCHKGFKRNHFIPSLKKTLRCLYYSLIYPYLTNTIEAWANSSKTKFFRLRRLLDRDLNILGKASNDSA